MLGLQAPESAQQRHHVRHLTPALAHLLRQALLAGRNGNPKVVVRSVHEIFNGVENVPAKLSVVWSRGRQRGSKVLPRVVGNAVNVARDEEGLVVVRHLIKQNK